MEKRGHTGDKPRRTIGLLVSQLEPVYHGAIWRSCAYTAREAGVNLVVFAGGSLMPAPDAFETMPVMQSTSRMYDTQGNFIYDMPTSQNCDGLIIVTSALGTFSTAEEMTEFCAKYASLPTVSFGLTIPGLPSVISDSRSGVRDAVRHQIEVHGHRKIAFIRGPEDHPEAIARFESYRDTLQEFGIGFEPSLTAPGDFLTITQSKSAIQRWLRQGVQSVVVSNDSMALDVIRYVQSLGVRVPYDLAVIGFDDRPSARETLPPLTTVRQPLTEMAAFITEMLLTVIEQGAQAVPELTEFPTVFVQRQSCGCSSDFAAGFTDETHMDDPVVYLSQNLPVDDANFVQRWAEKLMLTYNAALGETSLSHEDYQQQVEALIYELPANNVDLNAWLNVLVHLRQHLREHTSANRSQWLRAEGLWDVICATINHLGVRRHSWGLFRFEHDNDFYSFVSEEVLATYDPQHLEQVMRRYFEHMGIPKCVVVAFGELTAACPLNNSARILASTQPLPATGEGDTVIIPTQSILPSALLDDTEPWHIIVEPLFSQTTHLGYAVFEMGTVSGAMFTHLRSVLSSAVMSMQLVEQLTNAYIEVEERVVTRTGELIEEMNQRAQVERARAAIYEISEAARNSQDLEGLYPQIHKIVSRLLPAENFYIAQVNEQEGVIEFPYFVDENDPQPEPRPLDSPTVTSLVIQRQEPLLIDPDTFDSLVDQGASALIGSPSIDWLGVPLNLQGKTFGALVVQTYSASLRYTQDDLQLLNFVSDQVALAIHRVRTDAERTNLVAALRRRTAQLETASQITKLTTALRDVQQVLDDAVALIQEHFVYYFVGIYLIQGRPEQAVLRAASGEKGKQLIDSGHALQIDGESMIGWCTAHGQPRLTTDVSEEKSRYNNPGLPDTRSELVLPLLTGNICIGAVSLQSDVTDAFNDGDIRLLQAMMDHIAITIENAALHERIRSYTTELESTVAERTAALRATNEELTAFAYSVSHDLRAPLRRIDGFSEAVIQDFAADLPDMARDYLRRVRLSAQQMNALIEALLELSRVTRGEIYRTDVDMGALSRDIFELMAQRAPERQVTLQVDEGLMVNADPRLLRVVMDNLIGNAWKFTHTREESLIEVGAVNGTATTYYVRDNGVGFDPNHAEKLFAPFQRLHDVADFEGTGIGLATVQRIVRRHNGTIWADGKVDEGATFYFTLG